MALNQTPQLYFITLYSIIIQLLNIDLTISIFDNCTLDFTDIPDPNDDMIDLGKKAILFNSFRGTSTIEVQFLTNVELNKHQYDCKIVKRNNTDGKETQLDLGESFTKIDLSNKQTSTNDLKKFLQIIREYIPHLDF